MPIDEQIGNSSVATMMEIKHCHRIIPGHMGGDYSDANTIMLTVSEHATAHKVLYEQYGHWQDRVAWQGLAGIIGHEEAVRQANIEAHPKGRKLSLETRAKMSLARIGNKNARGNKGKKLSPEHIAKIRVRLEKVWTNPEYWNRIRIANTGKKRSPEVVEKMRQFALKNGTGLWNKGKKRSQETIGKIRASRLRKTLTPEIRAKISKSVSKAMLGNKNALGCVRSPEVKAKISATKRRNREMLKNG